MVVNGMKSYAIPLPIPLLRNAKIITTDNALEIHGDVQAREAKCPACTSVSPIVHGYYQRRLSDLPIYGYLVTLVLRIQRRKCLNRDCNRRTFAIVPRQLFRPFQRFSQRLREALYHIGQVAGGQAGARLASKLSMPVSGATLLRIIRQRPLGVRTKPEIIGIDDWAKRKGHSYGTIVVDHETHQVIDLLPDRSGDSVAAWLKARPTVHTVTRDRSPEYARGIREGLPRATQVADRWHLLKNLVEATEKELAALLPRLHKELGMPVKAQRLRGRLNQTESEKQLSQSSRAKRVKRYELVQFMKQKGLSQRRIARLLKMSRGTVRKYYTADTFPEFKSAFHRSKLDIYLPYLEKRYQEGHGSALKLWEEIVAQGYPQSPSQVVKWLAWRNKQPEILAMATRESLSPIVFAPPPKKLSWLFFRRLDELNKKEKETLNRLLTIARLADCCQLVREFREVVMGRKVDALFAWLRKCETKNFPVLKRFADGVVKDLDAVQAAIEYPWSNGLVEGQINKLKLLKRQMYGRAKLDLLRCRVMYQG